MTLNFSDKIYAAVKKIPTGRVASYGKIARLAGKPKAARAVGGALNKNPKPFLLRKNGRINPNKNLIPCHRVIRSDGRVGGYAWGAKKKIALLRGEGIKIRNNKIFKEFFLF